MLQCFDMLLDKMPSVISRTTSVIDWASPVPAFGPVSTSAVATVGINPSNREFVDLQGRELSGKDRRFHTLTSLDISCWSKAKAHHKEAMIDTCHRYFAGNPYSQWFQELDCIINGLEASFYANNRIDACHIDIVPFATSRKWATLSSSEKETLFVHSKDAIALLLRESDIELLIANGASVIRYLELLSDTEFEVTHVPAWDLPRKSGPPVKGFSYHGTLRRMAGVPIGRTIEVIGFNHNIQSSFGVSSFVKRAIRNWIRSFGEGSEA